MIFAVTILMLAVCRPHEPANHNPLPDQEKENPIPDYNKPEEENNDEKTDEDEDENEDENEDPDKGENGDKPPVDYPMLTLSANAASGSAYSLIRASGFDYETPDQTGGGHEGVPHILQQFDDTLKKNVFAFVMHHANDRNVSGDWTRQRVEIKVDHRTGSSGRDFCALDGANEGRGFIYRWKFKLPSDFAPSNEFTHIHQIKNEGGDSSAPVISLTARLLNNNRRMVLIYRAPSFNYGSGSAENSPNRNLAGNSGNSLDDYLGEWVQCEERVVYSSDPALAAYSIKIIRIRDDRVLLDYTHSAARYASVETNTEKWPFVTWRSGNTHGRPKFGLYRRIFSGGNPGVSAEPDSSSLIHGLKDETVLYADFEVIRIN